MIFLFGIRSSTTDNYRTTNTSCDYCQTNNGHTVSTFGSYFHLFFIPIFPTGSTKVVECTHCKKTSKFEELNPQTQQAITDFETQSEKETKRPLWHCCGCFLIIAVIAFVIISSLIAYAFKDEVIDPKNDHNRELLENDIKKLTSNLDKTKDSIAVDLKTCMNVYLQEQMNSDRIKYYTRQKGSKLLVLIKAPEMSDFEKSSRKNFLEMVEECLELYSYESIKYKYIGIEGTYTPVLVSTPYRRDLGGSLGTANFDLLLPFYDDNQEMLDEDFGDTTPVNAGHKVIDAIDNANITNATELSEEDLYKEQIYKAIEDGTTTPSPDTQTISYELKQCLDKKIKGKINTNQITYHQIIKDNKLSLNLGMKDISNIPEDQLDIPIKLIEKCLEDIDTKAYNKIYISVNDGTDPALIKTPSRHDYDGIMAEVSLLYEFFE